MVQVGVESENGWRPPDLRPGDARLKWFTVPGTESNPDGGTSLQLQIGRPATILLAVAAAFNRFVEPLRDADSASYTDGNAVFTSNHKNATAADFNWNGHAFQVRGTFRADQQKTIRAIVDFFEGWIFWAGDWDDPVDEMHWQLGYGTWARSDADFADFVKRKIRADGTSTFGGAPADNSNGNPDTHAPTDDAASVLYDAVPVIDEARAAALVGPIRAGLVAAQCNNPKRIAEFLAQTGWESDGYNATEEYASGAAYEGRCSDLGNCQPGDGVRFKGRGWIMLTGRAHYAAFGAWAVGQHLVTDPNYFVNNPTDLALPQWAGVVSAWYWTVARPQINAMADAGDLVGVTKAINGGTNGLEDGNGVVNGRRTRYNQAIALGDRLLALITPETPDTDEGEGLLSGLTPEVQQQVAEAILRMDTNVTWLRQQFDATDFGPDSSMGHTADGRELTVRDGLAEDKRNVETILAAITSPGVAFVTLQAAAAPTKTPAKRATTAKGGAS